MARLRYDDEDCNRFVRECTEAGLEVSHYRGRSFWQGPSVTADCVADVMSVTRVRCQHDSMGLGVVVYPIKSGHLVETEGDDEDDIGEDELDGLVPKLYLYDCGRGQGAVYARSLEEAQRTALFDSGRSDPPRNVHLATAEETTFRRAMGGSS